MHLSRYPLTNLFSHFSLTRPLKSYEQINELTKGCIHSSIINQELVVSERLLISTNVDYLFTWTYPSALNELKLFHSLSFFIYLTSGDDGEILSVGNMGDNKFFCANGHELSKEIGIPLDYATRGRDVVVNCDVCKRNHIHLDKHLYHCARCRYDLCINCSKTQRTEAATIDSWWELIDVRLVANKFTVSITDANKPLVITSTRYIHTVTHSLTLLLTHPLVLPSCMNGPTFRMPLMIKVNQLICISTAS